MLYLSSGKGFCLTHWMCDVPGSLVQVSLPLCLFIQQEMGTWYAAGGKVGAKKGPDHPTAQCYFFCFTLSQAASHVCLEYGA